MLTTAPIRIGTLTVVFLVGCNSPGPKKYDETAGKSQAKVDISSVTPSPESGSPPPKINTDESAQRPEALPKAGSKTAAEKQISPTALTTPPIPPGYQPIIEQSEYPDGSLASRRELIADSEGNQYPHGKFELWYVNHQKKLEMRFVEGEPHGMKRSWYTDGAVRSEGNYIDGLEDGVWVEWFDDGKKQHEFTMKMGAWDGMQTRWGMNGQKEMEGEWVMGRQRGTFTFWDESGKVIRQTDYGEPVPTSPQQK